jgi:hypothetical protein
MKTLFDTSNEGKTNNDVIGSSTFDSDDDEALEVQNETSSYMANDGSTSGSGVGN